MRVSDSVMTSTVANNLRRSFARIHRFQTELATGNRIQDPSDNPAGASRSLLLRSDIRNVEQYERNISNSLGHMNFVDSVLDSMVNSFIEVRGLAIQGASDTVNPSDRKIISEDVDEILEYVIGLGQSKFRGQFVFAGTENLEKPYEEIRDENGDVASVKNSLRRSLGLSDRTTDVGTLLGLVFPNSGEITFGDQSVDIDLSKDSLEDIKSKIDVVAPTGLTVKIEETTSSGSSSVFRLKIEGPGKIVDSNNVLGTIGIGNVDTTNGIFREIGEGIHIQMNVAGKDLFEGAQNAFTTLINLRDSLRNNDVEGIQQSITALEMVREKISDTRGILGARTGRVELSRGLLERFEVNLAESLSDIEDVDFAETVLMLQQEQNLFQSALMTGRTAFLPTLVDFLR